ncbi:organic cation transporter protein-like [Littorina saxatilis]|uniref:Major facilitator superfamily (MFS) profile domain-containing protein n=1 Tax=Littorina saxatilis TaxID=31220 RepID=A0AAN9BM02_9CAEN
MNVDAILRQIGEFGPYQKVIYVILNLLGVTHGTRMLMAVFLLYTPRHRCAIPTYPNDTYEVQSDYHGHLIQHYIPNNTKDGEDSPYDQCRIFHTNGSDGGVVLAKTGCQNFVYDTSVFENTAVVEFDMVCDDALLASHSQMSQMAGFLFGVLFFGAIGDKWGRKVSLCLAVVIYVAAGLGLSWTPQAGYAVFVFIRFVNGASSAGAYTSVAVLSVEMVGPSKRLWVGTLIHWTFAIGGMVLDLIGYFIRDWALINIVGTAPAILALSFWWIIPESPRWLAKHGRMDEAEKVLRKIAKYNGKTFPENWREFHGTNSKDSSNGNANGGVVKSIDQSDDMSKANGGVVKSIDQSDDRGKHSDVIRSSKENGIGDVAKPVNQAQTSAGGTLRNFSKMFTYRVLLIRNIVLFLNWFAVAMAYYGLSFTAGQLSAGSVFINFLLSVSMDFPATGICLLLLDRWGRRRLHTVAMVMGGTSSLLGVLTTMVASDDLQWITVVVAMVGKLGSSMGFILVYIYSSELFPTTVRSAGMGASSAFARLGSILASYVQQWSLQMGGNLGKSLPLLVFGAFSLVAGLLTFVLPETLHKDLPDTVEDALVFGKDPEKDEHQDPVKVVEVYTVGDVQIEMTKLETANAHSNHTPVPDDLPSSLCANAK